MLNHNLIANLSQGQNSNTFQSLNEGLLSSARCHKNTTLPFFKEYKVEVFYECVECCLAKDPSYEVEILRKVRQAKFQRTPLETQASLDPFFDDDERTGQRGGEAMGEKDVIV